MNFIRSLLHMLWMIITVIPWALLVVIVAPFASQKLVYKLCSGWLRHAVNSGQLILGIRNRVTGFENLPKGERDPAELLVKHQATWETFTMVAIMPHPLAFVFKKELLYIPFFGWAIGRLDMVHINRGRGSDAWRKVVEQGTRIMAQGTWMIMFPEGTRTPRGSQGEYKSGASRLAGTTKTPLVPIAVTSARCWPRKSFLLRPGTIDISIGRPIAPQGRRPDELMKEVEAWIESEMRRLDPEAYPPAA